MSAPSPSLNGGAIDQFYNRVAIVRSSDSRVIDIVMSGGSVFPDAYGVTVVAISVLSTETCEIYWIYDELGIPRFYSDGTNYERSLEVPITVFPGSIAVGNNPPISDRGFYVQFPDGTTQDSAVNRTRLTTFTAIQEFAAGISSGQIIATDTTDGIGVISTKGSLNSSPSRTGAIRLGYANGTSQYNTLLHNSAGLFTIYNGFSSTGSNLLNINSTVMNVNVPSVSGVTFTGLVRMTSGICASGGITLSGRLNAYSGICGSGGITLSNLFVAGGGATIISSNGILNLYKGTGISPSAFISDVSSINLNYNDGDGIARVVTIQPDSSGVVNTTQSLPIVTGTLLNTASTIVAWNNQGNTFSVRQVFNAGITASGGMTLFGSLNSYSGISASGITSDSGYIITAGAINAQTTSYTMLASDSGKIITMNPASTGITLTVPTGLPIGHTTTIIRLSSTLNVGISAASGVTINSFQNQKNIAGQHAAVSLISYTTDTFNLAGGLTG